MIDRYTFTSPDRSFPDRWILPLSRDSNGLGDAPMNQTRLPMDHPVMQWKPTAQKLKELRMMCVWMRIECNAWNWRFGPCCGLDSMDRLARCKRLKA